MILCTEQKMAISRKQLLAELLPGLNELFGIEYRKYGDGRRDDRNKQIHGATESEQGVIERGYQTPPESHTKGSSV
jgi:hypothetical protein